MKLWVSILLKVASLGLLALMVTGQPGADSVAPLGSSSPRGGGNGHYHSKGMANCNCTNAPAELGVCHAEKIDVKVGDGDTISVSTGLTTTSCATQTTPPGQCIYYQYNFVCETSFWFFWSCDLVSTGLKSRPATDADCFE